MANIICTKLTLEDINACFLRLSRTMNNNQASLQSQVTNIISSNIETKDKYNDTAIRALIDALTSRVTENEKGITDLENKTQDLSTKLTNLSTVIANINCSYNIETNTLTFTNSTGFSTNYELKDTTYTFSFDTETQTLTVHNDLDGEDTSNDFVQQITGTTYTFTWNNGTLTIHDNLADSDTTIDLDSRYYTESEIDAFIADINNNHNALANRVTTIEGKIPSAASSTNQLADKEYVNHSISTATATFRGTVETTSALAALTGDLNDYAFLKIYDATTHSYSYDRYKWVESGGDYGHWLYEYSIENTEFTAPQWEALNSGITCSLVDKITDVYNAKITLCQGGTCKGSFTLNQSNNQTISLDDHTVCAHSSTNLNTDLPLLACCSSSTGILEDAYFTPNVAVNTCCGRITACSFCFKKGGLASRRLIYNSKDYTGGTRCDALDIRIFLECFAKCHQLVAGEKLDVYYTWADANNSCICWGTNCSFKLSGGHASIINNAYDSKLFNDSCSGWFDFSIEVSSISGAIHTFRAYKGCGVATTAIIQCDNNYDYLSYRAYNVRKLGVNGNVDYKLLLGDDSSEFASPYYSCDCQITFNPSTGVLQLGNVCVNASLSSRPAIAKDNPLNCQNTAFLLTKAGNCVDNCSLGIQIGSGNVNRGFFDYGGTSGSFRWLTYYNAVCEVHNLPQNNAAYKTCCISFPANSTTYVSLGCIRSSQYENEFQLGFDVSGSGLVNRGVLKMLSTTASSNCFCNNNIELKLSNYESTASGIRGVGFISTGNTWNCYTCIVLKICNSRTSALTWRVSLFGNQINNFTTCIDCLGSTAPTFACLIDVPNSCRSFTYSNAIQELKGNICGTLNGCTVENIINDSVTCAYSGLGASLNGIDFTKNDGVLTLDDFSFDKVCDACSHTVSCGDVVRRIIETNQISGVGYRQRIGLGLDRYQDAWGYGLLSIGINDAGTAFTDYRFSCSGGISSLKNGTAQCITLSGRATDNVYRYNLPSANGNCAACVTYVQICTPEGRGSIGNSLHITFFGMMADLNLENSVNYYCGGYYGGLKFSRCSYTCSNCNCFWLAYCGYRQPVVCSAYPFTVLQCVKGTAPEGVTFSCFCDIVTAGVSGIQTIDLNGSSFTVSDGAATLDLTPDICYDSATSCMCVILGNQESTKVDLSSLASDHLVAYCGISTNYDRQLLFAPSDIADGTNRKVYYSGGCALTYNANTGLLKLTGAVCASNGLCTGFGRVSWGYSKVDVGGRASIRLFYDVTNWANGTTGITSKGLSGTFTHYRCSGYAVGYKSDIVMTANYGRNNASWNCCNTGCVKLVYDYIFGVGDRPLILYDSATCKYWLGLCSGASSGHTIRFDGIWSGAPETTCTLCYDANGCLPTGWTICTWGARSVLNRCINVYCGSTCKCNISYNTPLCLSANAFNRYAEVDENTYPGVCCTGDVSQAEIADFITMADVDACGYTTCIGTLTAACLNGCNSTTGKLNITPVLELCDTCIRTQLGNKCSSYLDISSIDDHLVCLCPTHSNKEYPVLLGCLQENCISPAYYSDQKCILFNACTGCLRLPGSTCSKDYKVGEDTGCISFPSGTSFVLLGCMYGGEKVGSSIGISTCIPSNPNPIAYSRIQMNLLLADATDFAKNSVELKKVLCYCCYLNITGIGFVKTQNCAMSNVCVVARVENETSVTGRIQTSGILSNGWTSNICRLNAAPTFDYFVAIPNDSKNFYYNNATVCFENVDFSALYHNVCCNTCAFSSGSSTCRSLIICDYIQPYGNCYDVHLKYMYNTTECSNAHIRVCTYWQCEKPTISAEVISGNIEKMVPYKVGVRSSANNCGCIGIDFIVCCATSNYSICYCVSKADAFNDITPPDSISVVNTTSSIVYSNSVCINTGCQYGTYLFSDVSANTVTANCIATTSSRKYKCDIDKWQGSALGILNATDIVQYKYKKENKNDLYHIGIIAEDTNTLISGKNQDQMRISDSVGLLMKAVQELTPWYKKLWIKLINKWKKRR